MSYEFSRKPKDVPNARTHYRLIDGEIPAHFTESVLDRLDKVEPRSMHGNLPIVWGYAHDYSVYDISGQGFIDFTSGIFVANVGHGNFRVLDAISGRRFLHAYNYPTMARMRYLERLTEWSGFEKAYLVSSGTEATEAALKLMRLHGMKRGRDTILCIDGNYHGRTMGAQLMGGTDGQREWIGFENPNILRVPWGSMPFNVNVGGIMLETYRGWDARFYSSAFITQLERFREETGALICFDEMQAGFGRTGRKFGFEHYGIRPDLVCVGKAMGGGFPLSGVLGRADILDIPGAGDMSSTHSANPLACAAGLAVLEELDSRNLVDEARRKGDEIIRPALAKLCDAFPTCDISGNGMVAAVIFDEAQFASRVAERCMQKGLLVVHTGRESIKIGPPLTIPDDALREGFEVLHEAIEEVAKE